MSRGIKLRKWSAAEDRLLLSNVNEFLSAGETPDYRTIASNISHRSPKQCRERYENSLQPDVKRGEWSFEETLRLGRLMSVHGQNWAAIKTQIPTRTYNAVKKKGRKLLGEIVDRNSIPKGTNSKATSTWSESEFRSLLALHRDESLEFEKANDYLFLALRLRTGRSEAEIERQLIQSCDCATCFDIKEQINAFDTSLVVGDLSKFKDRWSVWKAAEISNKLESGPSTKFGTKSSRRASTISTSSASTMASFESAPKRQRRDFVDTWSTAQDFSAIDFNILPLDLPSETINFGVDFGAMNFGNQSPTLEEVSTATPTNGLKEFDLSFLLPL